MSTMLSIAAAAWLLIIAVFSRQETHTAGPDCHYKVHDASATPLRLSELVKDCTKPQYACFYDSVPSSSSIPSDPDAFVDTSPTQESDNAHPDQVLFCGNVPERIKETCFYVNNGKAFLCGPKGKPLFNVRAFHDTDMVEIGTMNLKRDVYAHMRQKAENFSLDTSNKVKVHGPGCWENPDPHEPEGNLFVKFLAVGHWGTLNDDSDIDHPVMRTEHFVRDTLIAAIEADIEANKVAANDGAYFNCQTQPYGGKAWKSVDLYTDFYEPSDVLANGCGYQDPNQVIKATKPLCPDRCYTYRPCLQGVPVWRIPRTVTAAMYDRDKLLGVELKLEFETKSQVRTCGIEERLMTIIPGFLPLSFLGVGPGMFIYTIISVDCAIRFRSPPAETVHL